MASSNSPSMFESVTGKPVNPLWVLRGFSIAALIALLLAMFVFKSGNHHGFCLGMGAGILIGLIAQLSAIRRVEVNDTTRPSGVDNLSLTP